ncbi:MAG TPA: TonB-dependent receptor, partial [Chakrabartia sp.]|nr:TonB-dependent receptor [Chakrabartia sp.]
MTTSAVALSLAATGTAVAQTAVEDTEEGALGDIVVTAQKRSESVQDIPVTVTALGGEALAQSGSKDLLQAVKLVPGVIFSRAPDDGLALTFRGLGTITRSQAFDLSQALFTDGVFMGKARLYTTSFFDVDRMEFIKGTQSTMLGKNASLGAISVITKQPTDVLSVEASAGVEVEKGGYVLDGAVNLPLSDGVALRVAGHYNDFDGWVRNDLSDHNGPEQQDLGLRATLRGELSDTITLTASYQYARNEQLGASYSIISLTLPANLGSGVLRGYQRAFVKESPTGETYHDTKSHLANLKGEIELGDHTLVLQSSYIKFNLRYYDGLDYSPDSVVTFVRDEKFRQYTQEARIQSPSGGNLEYMAGVFNLSSKWSSVEDQFWSVPAFPPAPDPASGQLFNGSYRNNYDQKVNNFSVFASGAYKFTDALRLAGGVRWTKESKNAVFERVTVGPLTVWNTIANPPFNPTPLRISSTFFDGNVSLQYDINRDVMVFASYGHGSKSGG